jgi:hypothetical protein
MIRRSLAFVSVSFVVTAVIFACSDNANTPQITTTDVKGTTEPTLTAEPTTPPVPTMTVSAPDPNFAEPPELTAISPNSGTVGSVGPTIVVTGKNFVPRTIVQVNGEQLETTSFVSATELRATLPTDRLKATGKLNITVGTSPPGGGASDALMFDVVYPKPVLTSISEPSPPSALINSPDTKIVASGRDFAPVSVLTFDGVDIQTRFKSDKSIEGTVPAAKLRTAGTFDVAVRTPNPGGGVSSPISFTVSNPTVQLTAISPQLATVGSAAVNVTLTGAGFLPGSTVTFNGNQVAGATFVSATQMRIALNAAQLATPGDFPLVVKNPPPGGGVSMPLIFQVRYSQPVLTSVTPTDVLAGSPATELTLTGSGFLSGASEVTLNNAAVAVASITPTQMKVLCPANLLASSGNVAVRVVNPSPGGGQSASVNVAVKNATPVITSVTSAPIFVGNGDTQITINGSGFMAASLVQANGSNMLATFVGATQMTATLPQTLFASQRSIAITVVNPAPGGGTSNASQINVGCETSGVDVPLNTIGMVSSFPLSWATLPTSPRILISGQCPLSLSASSIEPFQAFVVQNRTNQIATLESWAVCNPAVPNTSDEDAFLAFYRRSSIPTTVAERQACNGNVSEGGTTYGSPESGGSRYCPGLTKANTGGMSLGICEKAVVYIQSYSRTSTVFPPPPSFKIGLK